jgi:drug/metabolite transporter (DMT)-like permease
VSTCALAAASGFVRERHDLAQHKPAVSQRHSSLGLTLVGATAIATGVALSVLSAVALGSADFIGGRAARTGKIVTIVAVMQAAGLVAVGLLILLVAPPLPSVTTVTFGLVAGLANVLGLSALYRGLAMGSMAVVAALSTVGSVAIPFAFSVIVLGTSPRLTQMLGVGLVLSASVVMAALSGRSLSRTAFMFGLVAALSFGVYFILLSRAASAGLWALLTSRASAVTALLVFESTTVLVGGGVRRIRFDRRDSWLAAAGVLDLLGSGFVVAALRFLPVGLIVPITGAYPVATALLARAFLRERLPVLAYGSVALALIGIALIGQG